MKVEISVQSDKVTVEPVKYLGSSVMTLNAEGISLRDLIENIGVDVVLDEIGKTKCIDHFDIEEVS
jgi:hypothetical protein